jgi:hypothetical protein
VVTIGTDNYLRLKVDSLPDLGDDDLLGGNIALSNAKIILTDVTNNAVSGLYLGLQPRAAHGASESWKAYPLNTVTMLPISLSQNDLQPPFAPKFDFFVPNDGINDSILQIKPSTNNGEGDFDFKLTIEASAALDYTLF